MPGMSSLFGGGGGNFLPAQAQGRVPLGMGSANATSATGAAPGLMSGINRMMGNPAAQQGLMQMGQNLQDQSQPQPPMPPPQMPMNNPVAMQMAMQMMQELAARGAGRGGPPGGMPPGIGQAPGLATAPGLGGQMPPGLRGRF